MAAMKTLPQILERFGLAFVGFAFLAPGSFAQGEGGKVKITETRIEIHPGTKLSTDDQKALSDVLKKFDKSLYKMEEYKNGKVTKTDGKLNDMHIDKALVSELASAKAHGLTVNTTQIVNTFKTWQQPPPAGMALTPAKEKELVRQVAPIVEKYSKK
jgi:hypothetical protein